MPKRPRGWFGLFEVVLIGGALVALGASFASEAAYTLTILAVGILAITALCWDTFR